MLPPQAMLYIWIAYSRVVAVAELCLNATWSFAGGRKEQIYSNASVSHEERIQIALDFANSVAYECITLFFLTPCLLNQGNRAGRKSRSHPCPEAGSVTIALADRDFICLKTANMSPLFFSFQTKQPNSFNLSS